MDDLVFLIKLIGVGVVIIILCYGAVRGMSFAYFRTKFEHFRAVMKETRKGDTNDHP